MAKTNDEVLKLREKYSSERGKQCATVAAEIVGGAKPKLEHLAEARQWLKLGLAFDKASDDEVVGDLEEKMRKRDEARKNRGRLKGNVVPLSG